MIFKPRQLWRNNQKIRYLTIGAWNTAAGYGIFAVLYLALGEHIGYLIIAVLSHLLAVTQSFVTQRRLVFLSTGNWQAEYIRFHLAHLGSLTIGLGMLSAMVEVFRLSPLVAQGMITVLVVIFSYFVHLHFTFRKAKDV